MQLLSLSVRGFAKLARPVSLGPIGPVNVIHGPNNVGKSCLLRALELYFRTLGCGEGVTRAQPQILDKPDPEFLRQVEASRPDGESIPLLFEARWRISPDDFTRYGIIPETSCKTLQTDIEIKASGRTYEVRVVRLEMDGKDVATLDRMKEPSMIVFGQQVRRLLADATPFQQDHAVVPFRFLGRHPPGMPQSLRDALFDARMSRKAEERQRWAVFVDLAQCLRPELGQGNWETVFNRESSKADLIFLKGEETVTVDRQGEGVQRFLTLLAELCTVQEPYVALEEPEWRLSPDLQKRLLDVATRLVERMVIRHVFITTHSPTLAQCKHSFEMSLPDGHPHCQNRPWKPQEPEPTQNGAEAPGAPDLGNLIGLVEDLADLDPDSLLETGSGPA